MGLVASMDLVPRVLQRDPWAIARLISRAESRSQECRDALAEVYRHAGGAHIVGITGVPGGGKSSLVARLAEYLRKDGRTVGILAIDPSSPFSGGAILGDRIRMGSLSDDAGVYARSMATRGEQGGLAPATLDAIDVLDAAGFAIILVETVGVGQDEVDIVQAAHTTVVVSPPGLGDDVQAIKAGLLENIHVVSKGDRADAQRTVTDLRTMLGIEVQLKGKEHRRTPVIATSSVTGEGIDLLARAIDEHRRGLDSDSGFQVRRRAMIERRVLKYAQEIVRDRLSRGSNGLLGQMIDRVTARQTHPYEVARSLVSAAYRNEPS
jgi:LAO/AO transport system kinase